MSEKIITPYVVIGENLNPDNEEQWRELRRRGIGGSDAGAILGYNKYKSALNIYAEKLALVPPIEENDAMKHGKRMEPVLRREFPELYKQETGITIDVSDSPWMYQSVDNPYMLASLDGFVDHPDYGVCGLEIKTANPFMAKDWEDNQVPDSYYAQVQHYMSVMGFSRFFIAVLIGVSFEYREVPRNDDFINEMIVAEYHFWHNHVLANQMPAPTGAESEDDVLINIFNNQSDATINIAHFESDAARYKELSDQITTLEKEKDYLKNNFKAALGEAKCGVAGKYKITWSRFEQERLDSKALKEKMPEIYSQFAKTSQSSRLTISGGK